MKRLVLACAALLCLNASADAYWFWPIPNPELVHWYQTYTTVQHGAIVLTVNPLTTPACGAELRQILDNYPLTAHRIVRINNTGDPLRDFRDAWTGTFGPGDEAAFLLETLKWLKPAY